MTFVSWRHRVPEERSGEILFVLLWTHNKENEICACSLVGDVLQDLDQEPVVKQLTLDPVQIKDDHFSQPLDGSDSSRGAMNFPIPEVRYLIKEISVIWHLYGGKDFGSATFTASPTRSRGWGWKSAHPVLNVLKRKQIYLIFYYFCPPYRSTPHSSPSQTPVRQVKALGRAGGGKGRNPDILMEIQLSKVIFFTWRECLFIVHSYRLH